MALPLLAGWRISGESLPERLLPVEEGAPDFTLPGAASLMDYTELLGLPPDDPAPPQQDAPKGARFALPALIPEDAPGCVTLSREIDFGPVRAQRAWLCFDMLCGSGEVQLVACPPRFARPGMPISELPTLSASFSGGPLTLDVTPFLASRRRCILSLRFDASRPAGACGPIALRLVSSAMLKSAVLTPETDSLTLRAQITALKAGDYLLRMQLCPVTPPDRPESAPACRETRLSLTEGETRDVRLSMEAALPAFIPGQAYAAPGVKLWLFETFSSGKTGPLCDGATLLCGMPAPAPKSFLPLCANDTRLPPQEITSRLQQMHVCAVSLPVAAPDMLYRCLTRAGICVQQTVSTPKDDFPRLRRYPCVARDGVLSTPIADPVDNSPVVSAWQLGGLVTYPRPADPGLTETDLLAEIAGREVNPEAAQDVLAWLRVLSVRLRAEAIRQGKAHGALCAPGEWHEPDIESALKTALAPLHLSALPLCGAWWTGARFSAALHAFIPEPGFGAALRAEAVLENAQGEALARASFPCPPRGGALGIMTATLPDAPCVLELVTRLYAGSSIVETCTLPVYVGERGILEAAFQPPL